MKTEARATMPSISSPSTNVYAWAGALLNTPWVGTHGISLIIWVQTAKLRPKEAQWPGQDDKESGGTGIHTQAA